MNGAGLLLTALVQFVLRVIGLAGEWLLLRHPFIGFAFALALVVGGVAWARTKVN